MAGQLRAEMDDYLGYASRGSVQRRAPVNRSFLHEGWLRDALMNAFEGTCAYCETRLGFNRSLTVSQHRPPGFAANEHHETDILHYIWLTYEWENLYPTCDWCTRHKENLFPVRKQRGPVGAPISSLREIEGEKLLDPCFHDPADHLHFDPRGFVSALSEEGKTTIDILNLNREDLVHEREAGFLQARRLLMSGDGFSFEVTGCPSAWGSQVISGSRGSTEHPGATSLALLHLAREAGLPSQRLGVVLDYIRQASPAARARLLGLSDVPVTPRESPADLPGDLRSDDAALGGRPKSKVFKVNTQPLSTLPITSIRIRNFKALRAVDFALPVSVDEPDLVPCMLLLGENAAGKSTVLEAITLALLGTQETEALDRLLVDDEVGPSDVANRPDPRDFNIVSSDPVEVEIGFGDQSVRLTGASNAARFDGSEETAKVLLAYGPRRFFTRRKTRRMRAPARRVQSLFDPMTTIASPIDWLLRCDEKQFTVAVRALREILMLPAEAEFARENDRLLIDTESGQLPLEEMSVGYKSVIAMATDIMRELMHHYDNIEYAQAVVLIVEIETHLHPRWKMRIVGRLRRAFPKVQFIITTHDPLCLRGMYHGEVFVLRRDEKGRIESVEDLPDVRGMRAEQILMSEFFGLGSTDPETEAKLIRYQELVSAGIRGSEVRELRENLEKTMKVGDTIQDQVVAEAMREAGIDPFATLGKVKSESRAEMVRSLVDKIGKRRERPREGAP